MIAVLELIRVSPGIYYGFLVSLENEDRTRTKEWEDIESIDLAHTFSYLDPHSVQSLESSKL